MKGFFDKKKILESYTKFIFSFFLFENLVESIFDNMLLRTNRSEASEAPQKTMEAPTDGKKSLEYKKR